MSIKLENPGFDTVCIHGGHVADKNRAHLTPIYATSTYTFDSAEQAKSAQSAAEETKGNGQIIEKPNRAQTEAKRIELRRRH